MLTKAEVVKCVCISFSRACEAAAIPALQWNCSTFWTFPMCVAPRFGVSQELKCCQLPVYRSCSTPCLAPTDGLQINCSYSRLHQEQQPPRGKCGRHHAHGRVRRRQRISVLRAGVQEVETCLGSTSHQHHGLNAGYIGIPVIIQLRVWLGSNHGIMHYHYRDGQAGPPPLCEGQPLPMARGHVRSGGRSR